MSETTTIEIRRDQWKELNSLKEPGDSMKDVLDQLLNDDQQRHTESREAAKTPDKVEGLDLPGTGEKLQERREAVRAVLTELQERGTEGATSSELKEKLYSNHSARYESERSWWKNCISPALSNLRDQGLVTLADRSAGRWRWNQE